MEFLFYLKRYFYDLSIFFYDKYCVFVGYLLIYIVNRKIIFRRGLFPLKIIYTTYCIGNGRK